MLPDNLRRLTLPYRTIILKNYSIPPSSSIFICGGIHCGSVGKKKNMGTGSNIFMSSI